MKLREQTDDKKEKQTEDNSRERGVESQLKAAAQRGYPEDVEDPMVAPPDSDIHQSGRVLELQNKDFWLRRTDVSWHLPIHMTIREEPFKNDLQGHPKNGRPRSKKPRSRRSREAMTNGIVPTGSRHLGHGNNH